MSRNEYDVIVVGGGHAGIEAAAAAARLGANTVLLTNNLDTIGLMSCNPAVGGIGKGHIVREIDALGGLMGRLIDKTGIQFRMLNNSKGAAMQGPRAQADKSAYRRAAKGELESIPNLRLRQDNVTELVTENVGNSTTQKRIIGVRSSYGTLYSASRVVLCCGTFLRGVLHCGTTTVGGGRGAESPSDALAESLRENGITLQRFKTGTPPRIHARSVDYAQLDEHLGDDEPVPFSFMNDTVNSPQVKCWITWTTPELHELIREHLPEAPTFSGQIRSTGPRYCPSIETKIDRFSDKDRHQLFLEPEGLYTDEIYVNGFSTSFGREMQERMVRMIIGLQNVEIMRYAYAIEYDYAPPEQVRMTLETKQIDGLYLAGQLNGTTGYEEAGGLGLVAGANAALAVAGREPFLLQRDQAYIGVMLDDLMTRGIDEPYRMFTSRAEYRLLLRHDNADRRLTPMANEIGLADAERFGRLRKKQEAIYDAERLLNTTHDENGSMMKFLARPETKWEDMVERLPVLANVERYAAQSVTTDAKYRGYITRQETQIEHRRKLTERKIPAGIDYSSMRHLRHEAREKFAKIQPADIAQASRISGITPADIAVMIMYLKGEVGE
ncbi:MAG: tRNA uridine-5-carboxymethylaminomethyl(34) synthesis enzyme MnmG [Planctomycetaceae bacterium]|jgi:tRNA uridine 5-carboxymethylaminomethyl modification enzyme|nr:tRNA uridine-5-carboxymethylaminomethyl(34) synthesis enzyme MnmG [Planctomycetaceae bacterium]